MNIPNRKLHWVLRRSGVSGEIKAIFLYDASIKIEYHLDFNWDFYSAWCYIFFNQNRVFLKKVIRLERLECPSYEVPFRWEYRQKDNIKYDCEIHLKKITSFYDDLKYESFNELLSFAY